MANTVIQLKKSGTPSATPPSLANGELAINYADGKLFYKAANGTILQFASGGGSSFNFSTVNANSTLIVADTTDDILTLVSGNNITIIGDAVNDKITVGLSNDVNIPGKLNVAGDFTHSGGTFYINNGSGAGGTSEGGEIQLANATQNQILSGRVSIDIYENKLRFFETNSPNRGAFINIAAASAGVGSDLLAGLTGTTDTTARTWAGAAYDKANAANVLAYSALPNTNGVVFNGTLTASANLQADKIISTNNGNGENFKVGDDAWIGDTNVADTIRIKGQQNPLNGFIAFGNNDGVLLGRSGSGPLTFDAQTIWHAGNDGASSGLDADLLDGQHGSYYGTTTVQAAAFGQANLAYARANTANITADVGFGQANLAYNQANVAASIASAAFDRANTGDTFADLAWDTANAAFNKANSANVLAFNALPNTSGAWFNGNLTIGSTTSNVYLGDTAVYANLGTAVSGANSGFIINQAWNNASGFSTFTINVSNLNSTTSSLINARLNGVNKFTVRSNGTTIIADGAMFAFSDGGASGWYSSSSGTYVLGDDGSSRGRQLALISNGQLRVGYGINSSGYLGFVNGDAISGTVAVTVTGDGTDAFAQRRSTGLVPQTYRLYNRFFDLANNERLGITWQANTINISSEAYGNGSIRPIAFTMNTSTVMYITNTGSIGIGTTSPLTNLEVASGSRTSFSITSGSEGLNSALLFNTPGAVGRPAATGIEAVAVSSYDRSHLYFALRSAVNHSAYSLATDTKMVIQYTGNVGIGTTSPTSTLHVAGSTNITGPLIVGTMNLVPTISSVFDKANTANITADYGFAQANIAYDKANVANITADVAFGVANLAYAKANASNITADYGFAQANQAYAVANSKFSANGGVINGDVSISGNLSITGNTTFINVSTYRVSDPLIYLASNNYSSDIVDIGIIANYVNTNGQNVHTGVFRDAGTKEWYVFQEYNEEPINNVIDVTGNNFTIAVLNADIKTNNLWLSGINVQPMLSVAYGKTNAAYAQANTANITADFAFNQANLAFFEANNAETIANTAYDLAASATVTAENSFVQANTARNFANVVYNQANTAYDRANTSLTVGQAAFGSANDAYAKANDAATIASAAFDRANTANITADASFAQANLAYTKANAALVNATTTFAGTLTITGDLITQGNVTLGDASTDTITINGSSIALGNNQNIDSGTMFIDAVNNRVGIGTSSPAYKLEVSGSFAAQTKSFVINHQTKPGGKLRYGSLEGPENGVYIRGKTTTNIIELPDYWEWLVDRDSITVNLTPIGKHQKLYVEKIEDNKVYIKNAAKLGSKIECFYMINAERKDVEKLIVEF